MFALRIRFYGAHLKLTIKLPIVFSLRAKPQLIEKSHKLRFMQSTFVLINTLTSAERRRSKKVSLRIIKAHTYRVKHRHIMRVLHFSVCSADTLKKGCMCARRGGHTWTSACSRASDCAPRLIFMIPQKSNYLYTKNNHIITRRERERDDEMLSRAAKTHTFCSSDELKQQTARILYNE